MRFTRKFKIIILIFLMVFSISNTFEVTANTQEKLPTNDARDRDGSSYWITSNIREWLNSDEIAVSYTNTPPAYRTEAGFLTNFTEDEQDGIAVTRRRSILAGSDVLLRDGGTSALSVVSTLNIFKFMNHAVINYDVPWKNYYFNHTNDKVFIMSPHELHYYVQQKGLSLRKSGLNNEYDTWWSTANLWNGNAENPMYIDRDGFINRASTNGVQGVVPAIHLKPSARLRDGKESSQLRLGEKVLYGQYNNQPIEWIVVNKTPDGYALLWANKSLTRKQFQNRGLYYRHSEAVNFTSHDVDISEDLKIYNERGDINPPRVYVENKDELDERKNEEFTLHLKATDESGIKKIILDDGTEILGDKASIVINENRNYNFQAVDNAGNYSGILIPINNINPPSEVTVKPSHTGWVNTDVKIDVEASNDINNYSVSRKVLTASGQSFYTYPNKITYANKKIRITGEVKLITENRPVENHQVGVSLTYQVRAGLKDGYVINPTYPIVYVAQLDEIRNSPKEFDVVMEVGSDYYNNLQVGARMSYPQVWGSNQYGVEFTNLKYELLDVDDFAIDKITLPDGKDVYDKRHTYTATKTGTYNFSVLDNRGKITSKSVDVKIDKVKPSLNIKLNNGESITQPTSDNITLNLSAADVGGSGLRGIRSPDGMLHSGDSLTYVIRENGLYTFQAEDFAGNVTKHSIEIMNIDKKKPDLILTQTPAEPTNEHVNIKIDAKDEGSGLMSVKLKKAEEDNNPNTKEDIIKNLLVNENGIYSFIATDKVGNTMTKSIEISNIDKINPELKITPSTTDITNENVLLTIIGTDKQSGVKRIKKPDGSWITGNELKYNVTKNGIYEFTVEDYAGNVMTKDYKVTNIEKVLTFKAPDIESNINLEIQDDMTIEVDIANMIVDDWRDGNNDWNLYLEASRFINKNHVLPEGVISLAGVNEIKKIKGNKEGLLTHLNEDMILDDGVIQLISATNERGSYEVNFKEKALRFKFPTGETRKGSYSTKLTWTLESSPEID